MRRAFILLLVLFTLACTEKPADRPLSEPGEKLYPIRGVLLARDAAENSITLQHEDIPGFMEAMTMDFRVRGIDVASLPPDKSNVEATLHVTSNSYWLTDLKPAR